MSPPVLRNRRLGSRAKAFFLARFSSMASGTKRFAGERHKQRESHDARERDAWAGGPRLSGQRVKLRPGADAATNRRIDLD